MTETIVNPLLSQPRIVNFSEIDLSAERIIPVSGDDSDAVVARLREYSDAPQVYVVAGERAQLVSEVLASLRAIRSTCYPHALFVVDGDFSALASPHLDIVPVDSPDGS